MPLTPKGKKILKAFKKNYGAKRVKTLFYKAQNSGRITGTHKKPKKRNR